MMLVLVPQCRRFAWLGRRMLIAASAAGLVSGVVAPIPALAFDWAINGHVVRIESTSVPDMIYFVLDTNAGSCTAGSWMVYTPHGTSDATRISNAEAAVAELLTAKSSGQTVAIYGENSGCVVDHIHAS